MGNANGCVCNCCLIMMGECVDFVRRSHVRVEFAVLSKPTAKIMCRLISSQTRPHNLAAANATSETVALAQIRIIRHCEESLYFGGTNEYACYFWWTRWVPTHRIRTTGP
jgi:hypothetical protein